MSIYTEADWRLFITLIRFDSVYHCHFKCNPKILKDYENLWGCTHELYHGPGFRETVNFGHIKKHYYRSHSTINPGGIVSDSTVLDPEHRQTGDDAGLLLEAAQIAAVSRRSRKEY